MSAVEVPPCCMEREQDSNNIYVNLTCTEPVIIDENGMQEYQQNKLECECKETMPCSKQENRDKDDQDERENVCPSVDKNQLEKVYGETTKEKCQPQERENNDDLLEDFREPIKQNTDSFKEVDECVPPGGECIAGVSGICTVFDEQDGNVPIQNEYTVLKDNGPSGGFDELDFAILQFGCDNTKVNARSGGFNEQNAVHIPSGDNDITKTRTSHGIDEQDHVSARSEEQLIEAGSEKVSNNLDSTAGSKNCCHSTDNFDQREEVTSEVISEKKQDDNIDKREADCKDDNREQDQNDFECNGEESVLRDRISESEEEETERLRVLDSLRAEYINKVWDDYIYEFLINSGHVTQAAIVDIDTGLILAGSFDFNIQYSEFQQILFGMQCAEVAYRYGLTVNGCNYKVRLADGRHGIFARSGQCGCTVCKTSTLVIIGVHDKSCNPKRCNEEVMRLGDFFTNKGM